MNRIKLSLLSIAVLSLSSGLFSTDLPNFSELAEKSGFSLLKDWSDQKYFFSIYLMRAI